MFRGRPHDGVSRHHGHPQRAAAAGPLRVAHGQHQEAEGGAAVRPQTILCVVCNPILRSVGWYFWCGCARCEDATECGSQVLAPCHDIDSFTADPVCVQVGSLQCSGLQERLAAHRDHGGGLGLQGGGGEQCGGVVTAAQPTLPDTGYRWEQRPGPHIETVERAGAGSAGRSTAATWSPGWRWSWPR